MSQLTIKVNSNLGKLVARTLGMTPQQLDMADGVKDGEFQIHKIVSPFERQTPRMAQLQGRIIYPFVRPGRFNGATTCEVAYFVDNGDGKIGNGDLFLHVDPRGTGGYFEKVPARRPSYEAYDQAAYGVVSLFKPRRVKAGHHNVATSSDITPDTDRVAKAVEALRGKSWNDPAVQAAFKAVCR